MSRKPSPPPNPAAHLALLISDEAERLAELSERLNREGFHVRSAGSIEDDLRLQKEWFEQLFRNLPHACVAMDPDSVIQSVNAAFTRIFQFRPEEIVGRKLHDVLVPEGLLEEAESLSQITFEGGIANKESLRQRKDGQIVPVRIIGVPIMIDGRIRSIFAIYEDISERLRYEAELKRALAEKEVLMRELRHRVKNNFAVISNLLKIESGDVQDERARRAIDDSRHRIRALASLYDRLARTDSVSETDVQAYVQDLARSIMHICGAPGRGIQLALEIAPLPLTIGTVVPLGLILNELLLNALKYAFAGRTKGLVMVRLRAERHGGVLEVEDDGVGLEGTEADARPDRESTLLELLAEQINGRISFRSQNGLKVRVDFPLATH
jgi:PAS domain S-box-containing protein